MDLNISALLITLQHTNASYKYLFFYALIRIIKKNQEIEEITFKEIIKEMLLLAWLPSFQFNLKFRKSDQIQELLKQYTIGIDIGLKEKRPTNKILDEINKTLDKVVNDNDKFIYLEKELLRYVIARLVRPFYKRLENMPESGEKGMYKTSPKILVDDYNKENPFYLINEQKKKISLNKEWKKYFIQHFIFLELWILDGFWNYMKLYNQGIPSLYEKIKFPNIKRNSLAPIRKFWEKIIKNNPNKIKCIFSNNTLNLDNFEIDHFIPWSYLGHDEGWNLVPILNKVNLIKKNQLPSKSHIESFIKFKVNSIKFAEETLLKKDSQSYLLTHLNFLSLETNSINEIFIKKYREKIENLRINAKNNGFKDFKFQINQN